MVDGTCMTREQYDIMLSLVRQAVEANHWCPLCECTIGNGDIEHTDGCILWVEVDPDDSR